MILLDAITCQNCKRRSVYQPTKRGWQYAGRNASEMDTDPVAISCPHCTHVYEYEGPEPPPFPLGEATQYPIAFYVPLVCDQPGCDSPLRVKAVRPAGTTLEAVCHEVPNWTLHDLFCPRGHPIVESKAQSGYC